MKGEEKIEHMTELERPERLLALAEQAVDLTTRAGAQFVDAAVAVSNDLGIAVEKSSIKTAERACSIGLSIRAFVDGGMGYVTSSGAVMSAVIKELAEKAAALARLASPDPDFVALPPPQRQDRTPETFDPELAAIGVDRAIAWACETIRSAQSIRSDAIISADTAVSASAGALASSTGIRITRKSTSVHLGVFVVVKDDTDVGSFADHDSARFLDDFKPEGLGAGVARRAVEYRSARKPKTEKTTLVLGPMAAFALIGAVADAANAESMQRRRSILADKLGETIGSTVLTITDNGLISKGLYSGPFDAEGAARKVVPVIDHGRFNAALHNSYTANKAGVANTGHGRRTGGVSHTNLQVQLGEMTAAQLIEDVDNGVYLELGGLSPDLVSGDISTNLDFAFKIEKGKLAYPLANAMVAGNLLDILRMIDAVSSDCRSEPGNDMPTIRVPEVQISAAGQ